MLNQNKIYPLKSFLNEYHKSKMQNIVSVEYDIKHWICIAFAARGLFYK